MLNQLEVYIEAGLSEPSRGLLIFVILPLIYTCSERSPFVQLTLGDAVRWALQANPQVQNANLTVAERQEDIRVARSGLSRSDPQSFG